ncbi:hypothetical protein ACFQ9X_24565 [Catenulispora yoronensis]
MEVVWVAGGATFAVGGAGCEAGDVVVGAAVAVAAACVGVPVAVAAAGAPGCLPRMSTTRTSSRTDSRPDRPSAGRRHGRTPRGRRS